MNRRGITLTEVLVAIFVTGMGLMALMTLFPLGAVNMSLAIKDDRASHAAANASALLRTVWREGLQVGSPDPMIGAALANGMPAYIDPIGQTTYAGNLQGSVGGAGNIPRIKPQFIAANPQLIWQYFTLMDDIKFDFNGAPMGYTPLPRETHYTWAYMLRVPPPGNPRTVEYAVVVYNRRTVASGGQLAEHPLQVQIIMAGGAQSQSSIIMVPNNVSVPVHKGSWVLDISNNPVSAFPMVPHSYFYRVNSVTQQGGNTFLSFDQPLRGFDFASGTVQGQLVIMDNVVEVFEKGTLE